MNYTFSELKNISDNYDNILISKDNSVDFAFRDFPGIFKDVVSGSVGTVVDHVKSIPRLVTAPFQLAGQMVRDTYNNELSKTNGGTKGIIKAATSTAFKPLTSVVKGAKAGVNQTVSNIKNTFNSFKQAPVQTTRDIANSAQDFKQEALQNGVVGTVVDRFGDTVQQGLQNAAKKQFMDKAKNTMKNLADKGINSENIGKSIRDGINSYKQSMRAQKNPSFLRGLKTGFKRGFRSLDNRSNGTLTDIKGKVTNKLNEVRSSNGANFLGDKVKEFMSSNAVQDGANKFMNSDTGRKVGTVVKNITGKDVLGKISGFIGKFKR